jgi:hypothetical protein
MFYISNIEILTELNKTNCLEKKEKYFDNSGFLTEISVIGRFTYLYIFLFILVL